MFFIYIDESGERTPLQPAANGVPADLRKSLYVLTAVTLFEQRWHGFDKTIRRHKAQLMDAIEKRTGKKLELADCEIKSNWIRIPGERTTRPFIADLTDQELTALVDLYYGQMTYHHMSILSVIVDKRYLHDYMDHQKIHRKSWELLSELVEQFMRAMNPKHQALMVVDDVDRNLNRSLAMKHAWLQDRGTRNDKWLRHICEMPMFTRSELSTGIQLADLCGYNVYRAFYSGDLQYPFFRRIAPRIWTSRNIHHHGQVPFAGVKVFPDDSPLCALAAQFDKETPPPDSGGGGLMSGGANPIQPHAAPDGNQLPDTL